MRTHGLPGTFVVIDGAEGVGKSTQMKLLRERLPGLCPGREIVFTREPGGTPFADEVYALFKKGMSETDAHTQFCLVFGSRSDHTKKLVLPALARGALVVSDRYEGSTYAYQVFAPKADELLGLFHLHQQLVPSPDLSLILEVPVGVTLARIATRGGRQASTFDLAGREFHERVAKGFRWYAKFNSGHRVEFIDGNRPEGEVHEDLVRRISSLLS